MVYVFFKRLLNILEDKEATCSKQLLHSSTKSEYRALTSTMNELICLTQFLNDLNSLGQPSILLFCDNQVTVHITTNLIFWERTKLIEIDCHFFHDNIADGLIRLMPIKSGHQLIYLLTKPLFCDLILLWGIFLAFHEDASIQDVHLQYLLPILRGSIKEFTSFTYHFDIRLSWYGRHLLLNFSSFLWHSLLVFWVSLIYI